MGQVQAITSGSLLKSRARDEIFDFVLQNCLAHRLGGERPAGYGPAFNPIGFLGKMAQPGDLIVLLQSGAYGASASPQSFLGHPEVVEVLI